MRFTKKLLIGLNAVVLVAVFLNVVAPKSVHAVVATLVQVANTSANPVPTLEQEAQSGFMVSGVCTFGGTGISAQLCEVNSIYIVPAGRTAVLESFSGFCSTDTETALIEFDLALTAPGGTSVMQRIPPVSATPYNGTITHEAALNLKSYAYGGVSGSPISFSGFANADQDARAGCVFTLTGHLE
jgi:hypothetical protein